MKVKLYKLNAGPLYSSLVTIDKGVSRDPRCYHWKEFINGQQVLDGAGAFRTYNNGPTMIRGLLIINDVSRSVAESVQDFFSLRIRFSAPFSIFLDESGGADMGKGVNGNLLECHLDADRCSTAGICVPTGKGNRYNIEIPYICYDLATVEGSFP